VDGCGAFVHCGDCTGGDSCGAVTPNVCDNAVQIACGGPSVPCPTGYYSPVAGFSSDMCNAGTACDPTAYPLAYLCVRMPLMVAPQCAVTCGPNEHLAGPWPPVCCAGGENSVCISDP
jgi:hypothetical protein